MKCGYLQMDDEGKIRGAFLSWELPEIKLALRNNPEAGKMSGIPTHEVIAKNPHGSWVQIGVAWKNKINKGEKTGLDLYSLSLDNPTLFKMPLKLSAFPTSSDGKDFSLEYDRGEKSEQAAA